MPRTDMSKLSRLLTHSQKMALRIVADEEGRCWKQKLRIMWENSRYEGYEPHASTLQFLRNAAWFGPQGLIAVRPADYR